MEALPESFGVEGAEDAVSAVSDPLAELPAVPSGRGTGSSSGTALLAFAGTCLLVRKRILAVLDGLGHVEIILHAAGQMADLAADQLRTD